MSTMYIIAPLFIGTTELLLIGGMALLLFGGKKLPEMMRGLGQGVKEFKKGMDDVKDATTGNGEEGENDGNGRHEEEQTKDDGAERKDTGV